MYTLERFHAEVCELLNLEVYSDYSDADVSHLNQLAMQIRQRLSDCEFEENIATALWESLSGFELGKTDPKYREIVVSKAMALIGETDLKLRVPSA